MSADANMKRLLKLYALATRGEGGERENARRLLDAVLEKSAGVTFADVERAARGDEPDARRWYELGPTRYAAGMEHAVAQLVFSFGLREDGRLSLFFYPNKGVRRVLNVQVNSAEYYLLSMFFDACCEAYAAAYAKMKKRHRKECHDFPDAFIAFNRLYDMRPQPPAGEVPPAKEEPLAVDWNDMEKFYHEHDRALADARPQLEGKEDGREGGA